MNIVTRIVKPVTFEITCALCGKDFEDAEIDWWELDQAQHLRVPFCETCLPTVDALVEQYGVEPLYAWLRKDQLKKFEITLQNLRSCVIADLHQNRLVIARYEKAAEDYDVARKFWRAEGLSSRTAGCLASARIHTLAELKASSLNFRRLPNFGKVSETELRKFLGRPSLRHGELICDGWDYQTA